MFARHILAVAAIETWTSASYRGGALTVSIGAEMLSLQVVVLSVGST